MPEQEEPIPEKTAEIADRLGVEILRFLNRGDDGAVYLLKDGRVLRRTSSNEEVAMALMLQQMGLSGQQHSAFPEIHGVWWYQDHIELNGDLYDYQAKVIIRDEMPDVSGDDLFRSEERIWKNTLRCLDHGWRENKQDFIDAAIAQEPVLRRVQEALMWATDALEVKILDLGRISNFGMRNGKIGIRDFSRGTVPELMLKHVKELDFAEVPVCTQRFKAPCV